MSSLPFPLPRHTLLLENEIMPFLLLLVLSITSVSPLKLNKMLIKNLWSNNKAVIRTTVEKLEDSLDLNTSYYGFILLTVLILLSLGGTYYLYSNPIHKVMSLLSMSILTVFLWMKETPFLFVYIVYILAFIGAVLMLFLSVVLMLPISSIHYKNCSWVLVIFNINNSSGGAGELRPPHLGGPIKDNFFDKVTLEEVLDVRFIIFLTLFISTYVLLVKLFSYFVFSWKGSLAETGGQIRQQFMDFVLRDIILNCSAYTKDNKVVNMRSFLSNEYKQIIKQEKNLEEDLVEMDNSPEMCLNNDNLKRDYFRTFGPIKVSISEKIRVDGTYKSSCIYGHSYQLPFTLLALPQFWVSSFADEPNTYTDEKTVDNLFIKISNLANVVFAMVYLWLLKLISKLYYVLLKTAYYNVGWILLGQYLAFMTILFAVLPTPLTRGANKVNRTFDTEVALESLKVLFYENYNLFLITSTVVLLIALIGAAIMTRHKKK